MKRFSLHPSHWFSGGLLALLLLGMFRPTGAPIPVAPSPAAPQAGAAQGEPRKVVTVTVYHVVSSIDDSWLEPTEGNLALGTEPMAGALNLMTELTPDESPLPPGTRALSVVVRADGVAWADFNKALVENFPGGSLPESLAINSVLLTLARFPGVRAVQFTVAGERIESLGGHIDLSEPQPVPIPGPGDGAN